MEEKVLHFYHFFLKFKRLFLLLSAELKMFFVIVEGFLKTEILQTNYRIWIVPTVMVKFSPRCCHISSSQEISVKVLFEGKLSLTSEIGFAPLIRRRMSFDYKDN